MALPIYIFDPTISDSQSKVRGVGRYLQLLKENITDATFIANIDEVPYESVFIQPFFNFFQPPLTRSRISRIQVAVIHDAIPHQYPQYFPTGIKGKYFDFINTHLSLKHFDKIVTDSQESKNQLLRVFKLSKNRVSIIYPCLPTSFNVKNEAKSSVSLPPPPYFIYVGDTTWNKNLVNIARAIKKTNNTCVFVGKSFLAYKDNPTLRSDPWLKEYDAFMKLVDNDDRFIFPGYVSDHELTALYKGAVANILVSHQEGFGFSFLEAASLSVPSILSDINIFRETAQDSAFFINKDDPNELVNAMQEMMNNTVLRGELGTKSYDRSRSFSPTQFTEGWHTVLQRL